jgi:hypothetical protein
VLLQQDENHMLVEDNRLLNIDEIQDRFLQTLHVVLYELNHDQLDRPFRQEKL